MCSFKPRLHLELEMQRNLRCYTAIAEDFLEQRPVVPDQREQRYRRAKWRCESARSELFDEGIETADGLRLQKTTGASSMPWLKLAAEGAVLEGGEERLKFEVGSGVTRS